MFLTSWGKYLPWRGLLADCADWGWPRLEFAQSRAQKSSPWQWPHCCAKRRRWRAAEDGRNVSQPTECFLLMLPSPWCQTSALKAPRLKWPISALFLLSLCMSSFYPRFLSLILFTFFFQFFHLTCFSLCFLSFLFFTLLFVSSFFLFLLIYFFFPFLFFFLSLCIFLIGLSFYLFLSSSLFRLFFLSVCPSFLFLFSFVSLSPLTPLSLSQSLSPLPSLVTSVFACISTSCFHTSFAVHTLKYAV